MKNKSIDTYLGELASKASTPGGGAVAAVTGAQAAALISMVCHLTKNHDVELDRVKSRSKLARTRFIELGEADIAGFGLVMAAYKLPRDSDNDKKTRQDALQAALLAAASAPLDTLELAASLVADVQRLEAIGNPNLITDVGIAALLIPATIQAARMNVLINLREMTEADAFRRNALHKIDQAIVTSQVLAEVATNINKHLEKPFHDIL